MPWPKQGTAIQRLRRTLPTPGARLKHRRTAVFIAAFSIIGGIVLLNASSAATKPVSLYLTPDIRTVAPNTDVVYQLRVDSGPVDIDAVQAVIAYPPSLMKLVAVEASDSRFTSTGPAGGADGEVFVSRGAEGGVSGDQLVADLRFRVASSTAPTIALAFTGNNYVYAAGDGKDVLGGLASTRGATLRIDGQAPAVALTTPSPGTTVRQGQPVTVTATASDDISTVSRVELYVNSVKIVTLDSPPYTYQWNTIGLSVGSRHILQARAYDTQGNVGVSQTLTATIGR